MAHGQDRSCAIRVICDNFVDDLTYTEVDVDLSGVVCSFRPMTLWHPDADQLELPSILNALGDPTRLAIVGYLASNDGNGMACGEFCNLGSKTALSYHFSRLREAGIIQVERSGTRRLVTLRTAALDSRFPGLLESVLATARRIKTLKGRPDGVAATARPVGVEAL